ncbi:MAG: YodL domain-containing protein [Eubacteriales bacterium]
MQNARIVHNLVVYSGNHVGFITDGRATVDEMFQSQEMEQWLQGKGLKVLWKPDVFTRLLESADSFGSESKKGIKTVRVWRLNKQFPQEGRFSFLADFRKNYGEPNEKQYQSIFQDEMGTENLEIIYDHLSRENEDLSSSFAYPLSVSDVIELFDSEESLFFYVDRYDFVQIDFKI